MEELSDINFLAVIEGRDYEHSLKKIVSISIFHPVLFVLEAVYRETGDHQLDPLNFDPQGFTKFHFTPLEVLAVIEGIQLRLNRVFSAEEIESGILEDLIIESDYDVLRVVSNCAFKRCLF